MNLQNKIIEKLIDENISLMSEYGKWELNRIIKGVNETLGKSIHEHISFHPEQLVVRTVLRPNKKEGASYEQFAGFLSQDGLIIVMEAE